MTKLKDKFSGAGPVRKGYEINHDRLEHWMGDAIDKFSGPLSIEQFKGGQSNPTYKLTTPNKKYVLRRKPPGKLLKGAHAVEREFRVIQALRNAAFPVAQAHALCEDETIIDTPFYIMDMVEGRVFWDASLTDVPIDLRPQYFEAMNSAIATLHSFDPNEMGLADYGRTGNYFERQISRWSRQYRGDKEAGQLEDMDFLAQWLPNHIPSGDENRIVHGDFRIDNMIWHPTEPRILAVLDWELSTLGHPLADFSYHLMMYNLPPHIIGGIQGLDLPALNIVSQEHYVAAYCRRTGRSDIADLNFYLAFNMFRFAAILHGVKGRMITGTAASSEAQTLVDTLPELASLGRKMAEKST